MPVFQIKVVFSEGPNAEDREIKGFHKITLSAQVKSHPKHVAFGTLSIQPAADAVLLPHLRYNVRLQHLFQRGVY